MASANGITDMKGQGLHAPTENTQSRTNKSSLQQSDLVAYQYAVGQPVYVNTAYVPTQRQGEMYYMVPQIPRQMAQHRPSHMAPQILSQTPFQMPSQGSPVERQGVHHKGEVFYNRLPSVTSTPPSPRQASPHPPPSPAPPLQHSHKPQNQHMSQQIKVYNQKSHINEKNSDVDEDEDITELTMGEIKSDGTISSNLLNVRDCSSKMIEKKVDKVISVIIDRLSDDGQYVSYASIENELKKCYNVNSIHAIGIMTIDRLPSMVEHSRKLNKVNAYIEAFMRVRAVATVTDLKKCLVDLFNECEHFSDLRVGPIVKLPMVYHYFKAPHKEEIPEISTCNILDHLECYFNTRDLWGKKIDGGDFIKSLQEKYKVPNPYHLGLKISSIPLLIQVLGRANRHRTTNLKEYLVSVADKVHEDVKAAYAHTIANTYTQSKDGYTLNENFVGMDAVAAVVAIFKRMEFLFDKLIEIHRLLRIDYGLERKIANSKTIMDSFSRNLSRGNIYSGEIFVEVLRLAICTSMDKLQTDVEKVFTNILPKDEPMYEEQSQMGDTQEPPTKDELVAKAKKYFQNILASSSLSIHHLSQVECRILEETNFQSFHELRQLTFLKFILDSDIAKFLEDQGSSFSNFGGTSIQSDDVGHYQCSRENLLDFIRQTALTNPENNDDCQKLESLICAHYRVKDVKHLQHGNVKLLMKMLNLRKSRMDSVINYDTALCSSNRHADPRGGVNHTGKLGELTRAKALACLQQCPLLECLSTWSHWRLIFQPQFGNLKAFLHKYGYMHTSDVQVSKVHYEMQTNILAMETSPGHLIRINPDSTYANFADAASRRDVHMTCAHLVSIIAIKKGVDKTPLDLMGSEIEQTLKQNTGVVKDSFELAHSTVGRNGVTIDEQGEHGARYVLDCIVKLPIGICEAVADKVFIQPLTKVLSNRHSKKFLLRLAQGDLEAVTRLQHLGLVFGVNEWRSTIEQRLSYPTECLYKQDAELIEFTSTSSDHSGDMVEQFDENVDLLLDVPTASNMVALMTTPVEMETDRTRDDGARDANVPDDQISALLQKEVETEPIDQVKHDMKEITVSGDVNATHDMIKFTDTMNIGTSTLQTCDSTIGPANVMSSDNHPDDMSQTSAEHSAVSSTSSELGTKSGESIEDIEDDPDLEENEHDKVHTGSETMAEVESVDCYESGYVEETFCLEMLFSEGHSNDLVNDIQKQQEEEEYLQSLQLHLACLDERPCYEYIAQLRHDEFGIGVELTPDVELLMKKQHDRQGRSLDRLSTDLYSKDIHFVLELIQNADDNSYDDANDFIPSVLFLVESDMISVYNNETGFVEKQVKAVCDVGSSTKPKENPGFIGQKGIGFKSVFRITDRPEIHSNHFHWYFDKKSCALGYIMPWWIDKDQRKERDLQLTGGKRWVTEIKLPFKSELVHSTGGTTLSTKFHDLHPSLLLFLHRLRKMTVVNKVQGCVYEMQRCDLSDNLVRISQSTSSDSEYEQSCNTFLLARKVLDSTKISVQAKAGMLISSTEIVLAFPIVSSVDGAETTDCLEAKPQEQFVFAYLPLRMYGFNFIVQADFEVPSTREDVNSDSRWNQWLRDQIPHVFVNALQVFQNHKGLSSVQAVCAFLRFVPLEGETSGFFTSVATSIIKLLRSKQCMPVVNYSNQQIEWRLPSQTVIIEDNLTREVLTPALLKKYLGVSLLHEDVRSILSDSMRNSLGIKTISTDHLIEVGPAIVNDLKNAVDSKNSADISSCVRAVNHWLVCIQRGLDLVDDDRILTDLRQQTMIYLTNGTLVALNESSVFVDRKIDRNTPQRKQTMHNMRYFNRLRTDLNILHPLMMDVEDAAYCRDLELIYAKLGVYTLQADLVITKHIIPVLEMETEQIIQKKDTGILDSYVCCIKEELDYNRNILSLSTLRKLLIVRTNKGVVRISDVLLHFPCEYRPNVNIMKELPGYDWQCIHPIYIQHSNATDIAQWSRFFTSVGVVDGLAVKQKDHQLSRKEMEASVWCKYLEVIPHSDTYAISDYHCEEFKCLLQTNTQPHSLVLQMKYLFTILQRHWDQGNRYSQYTSTSIMTSDGVVLKGNVETTFSRQLLECSWMPSSEQQVIQDRGNYGIDSSNLVLKYRTYNVQVHIVCQRIKSTVQLLHKPYKTIQDSLFQVPNTLYAHEKQITRMFSYLCSYPAVNIDHTSQFAAFLGICYELKTADVQNSLLTWAGRTEFVTSMSHICYVYQYLYDNLRPVDMKKLMQANAVIFYPASTVVNENQLVAGRFVRRSDVWWSEETGLFDKYRHDIADDEQQPLFRYCLEKHYSGFKGMEHLFMENSKIVKTPTLQDYLQLWCNIADNHLQEQVIGDISNLFCFISNSISLSAFDLKDLPEILKTMKSRKIFPTKSGCWASFNDYPMIPDNDALAKKFAVESNVHFIDDRLLKTDDRALSFLQCCGVTPLSDNVTITTITDGFQPFPKLQAYLSDIIPYLQRMIYHEHDEQYEQLKLAYVDTILNKLKSASLTSLEVVHSLKHNRGIVVVEKQKCCLYVEPELDGTTFYVDKDYMENYTMINTEIARYFSNGDIKIMRNIKRFLARLQPLLTDHAAVSELLTDDDIAELPDKETKWHIEAPPPPPPPPPPQPTAPPTPPPEFEGEHEDNTLTEPVVPKERVLTCWPPSNPNVPQRVHTKNNVEPYKPKYSYLEEFGAPPAPPTQNDSKKSLLQVVHEPAPASNQTDDGESVDAESGQTDGSQATVLQNDIKDDECSELLINKRRERGDAAQGTSISTRIGMWVNPEDWNGVPADGVHGRHDEKAENQPGAVRRSDNCTDDTRDMRPTKWANSDYRNRDHADRRPSNRGDSLGDEKGSRIVSASAGQDNHINEKYPSSHRNYSTSETADVDECKSDVRFRGFHGKSSNIYPNSVVKRSEGEPRVIVCESADQHRKDVSQSNVTFSQNNDQLNANESNTNQSDLSQASTGQNDSSKCDEEESDATAALTQSDVDIRVVHRHNHDNVQSQHSGSGKKVASSNIEHVYEDWNQVDDKDMYEDVQFTPSDRDVALIGKLLSKSELQSTTTSEDRLIGTIGERLVNQYLKQQQELQPNIVSVDWKQEVVEQATPYDFVITEKDELGNHTKKYIEVKSTRSTTKEYFPISVQQINFALQKTDHYHLFRVFGVGNPSAIRLTRIPNLASKLQEKQIRLMMLL